MPSEAIRDHLKRTGVSPALIKQLGVTSTVVEHHIGSGNALAPYMPFGEYFKNWTPAQKNKEAADFVIDTLDHTRNLRARHAGHNRQLPNAKAVKPVLLHENEMKRLGLAVQPTAYVRNPMEKGAYYNGPRAPIQMYKGDLRY